MKKIIVFTILLLSAIAVTVGTTITTAIQIQPAYSQAQTCRVDVLLDQRTCVTTGQNPTIQQCFDSTCGPARDDITHQQAGRFIGGCHSTTSVLSECTVTPP